MNMLWVICHGGWFMEHRCSTDTWKYQICWVHWSSRLQIHLLEFQDVNFPCEDSKECSFLPLLVGSQARWTGFQPFWGVAWWVLTTLKLAEAVPLEPVQEAEEVSLEHIRYPKPWSFVQHPLTLPWHCLDVTVNRTCMKRDTGWEQDSFWCAGSSAWLTSSNRGRHLREGFMVISLHKLGSRLKTLFFLHQWGCQSNARLFKLSCLNETRCSNTCNNTACQGI